MTEQPKQEFRGTFEGANSSARWSPDAAALAAISFTFDNGHLSTYTHAFPLLRKAGLVGHIAAITDLVGKPGRYSWEQIHEMAAAGWKSNPTRAATTCPMYARRTSSARRSKANGCWKRMG